MKRKVTEYDLLSMACHNMDIVVDDESGLVYYALIDRLEVLSVNLEMGKYPTDPIHYREVYTWVNTKLEKLRATRDKFEKRQPELMFGIDGKEAIFTYE